MTQSGEPSARASTRRRSSSLLSHRRGSALSKFKRRFSRPREPRIVFLGACEVGKTALITRLRADVFPHRYEPTIEESHAYFMRLRSTLAETVHFVDVTGAQGKEYASIRAAALEEGDGFVVVFSVKSRASFEAVSCVLEEIAQRKSWPKSDLGLRTMLVANQAEEEGFQPDPDDHDSLVGVEETLNINAPRTVTSAEALALAESYNITQYVETSALTALEVDSIPQCLGHLFGAYASEEQGAAQAPATMSLGRRMRLLLTRPPTIFVADDGEKEVKKSKSPSPVQMTRPSTDRHEICVAGSNGAAAGDRKLARGLTSPTHRSRSTSPAVPAVTSGKKASSAKSWRKSLYDTVHSHDHSDTITSPTSEGSPAVCVSPPAEISEQRTKHGGGQTGRSTKIGRRKGTRRPQKEPNVVKDDPIGRYYGSADLYI